MTLLSRMDQLEDCVSSHETFTEAIALLREDGIEDLIDQAGRSFWQDTLTYAKHNPKWNLYKGPGLLDIWVERIMSANRAMALHGLILAECAYFTHIPLPDVPPPGAPTSPAQFDPVTTWSIICQYLSRELVRTPSLEFDIFKARSDEAYGFLRRFVGTRLLPGRNAEEYIRSNDLFVYNEPTSKAFQTLSRVTEWSIVIPETGAPVDAITLALKTPSGYFIRANYSLTTRTLSTHSNLYSLRPMFRLYRIEHLYDYLLEATERLIQAALLDEGIVFGVAEPTPAADLDATEEANDTEEVQSEEAEAVEETRPIETTDERDVAIPVAPKSPYLRGLTPREAITAFSRLGAVVIQSHHPMVIYKGRRVGISNFHQTDPHIVRKSAYNACDKLGIPWADFVAAVY